MASWTSRSPSSEITTVSTDAAMSAAWRSMSNPVVTSVMRMPSACSFAAERPQVAMQERLAAGQHHALHVQRADRLDVPLEIVRGDLALFGVGLPDVAHHAAAVAGAVDAQREDRQALEPVRDAAAGAARILGRVPPSVQHLEAGFLEAHSLHVPADPARDQPRRSVEERGRRIDAGRFKEAGQRRVRNHRLAARSSSGARRCGRRRRECRTGRSRSA